MSRRFRLLLLVVGSLATLVLLALYVLYLAARHVPAFYRQAMAIDRAVLEQGSDRMLQQATALQSSLRNVGRWEALLTAEQINGWLAVDMVKNHPQALPPALKDPRVAIGPKEITVACRFEQGGAASVLSLTVRPYVPEPNVIALRIVGVRAGLLPAPLKQVTDGLTRAARGMELRLQWRHAGSDPVAMFSLPADDDGEWIVRIETLRLGEGEIYVSGTTQRRKP